ncbi:MAG: hypothetical protein V3R87_00815, partial [Dehalococcoidia bacterium]
MSATEDLTIKYDDLIESALSRIGALLSADYRLSKRAISLLLLQGDSDLQRQVREKEGASYSHIQEVVDRTGAVRGQPLRQVIAMRRQQEARRIVGLAASPAVKRKRGFADKLSWAMMNP